MCFLVLAGKNATVNGNVIGGHNDDLHGNTAAVYGVVEGKQHDAGTVVRLPRPWFSIGNVTTNGSNDIEILQEPETFSCFMLQTFRGYIAGDASAINEHQVAVIGGLNLAVDRNDKAEEADPLNKGGLAGGARYIALQRSKTARECVEKLGDLLNRYGAVFPSCVGITDKDEAWYFEIGGGTTWVAIRVPDDSYMVQSNGYRIAEIDPDDTDNTICSPNLLQFVKEKKLWDPASGAFHWAKAFGGKFINNPEKRYYNLRRMWSAMNLLSSSAKLDPTQTEFPVFMKADRKIDVRSVMTVLRDLFSGTDFEAFPENGGKGSERPVCVPSCIHSAVIETMASSPTSVGGTLWGCIGSPMTSPYIPHYSGHQKVLSAFELGALDYNRSSAFWKFRTLTNLAMSNYQVYGKIVKDFWETFEDEIFITKGAVEKQAIELRKDSPQKALEILTSFSNSCDALALNQAEMLEALLHTKMAETQYLHFAKPGLEW